MSLSPAVPPGEQAGWSFQLRLAAWGAEEQMEKAADAPTPTADGSRVSYHWSEELTEWYFNTPGGLEQAFTLERRSPASSGSGAPVSECSLRAAARSSYLEIIPDPPKGLHFKSEIAQPELSDLKC